MDKLLKNKPNGRNELSEQKSDLLEVNQELIKAAKPLVNFLRERMHPHAKVIVDQTGAEIVVGTLSTGAAFEPSEEYENPLRRPSAHALDVLLRELKYGRAVPDQKLLNKWITELDCTPTSYSGNIIYGNKGDEWDGNNFNAPTTPSPYVAEDSTDLDSKVFSTSDINTKLFEGQMLLSALAIIITESRTTQTPDEVLRYILHLRNEMGFDTANKVSDRTPIIEAAEEESLTIVSRLYRRLYPHENGNAPEWFRRNAEAIFITWLESKSDRNFFDWAVDSVNSIQKF